MSSIAPDPYDYDMGCVKGLGTKMIDFPIFEGRHDPEAYLDWEWQCEQVFQGHDLRGPKRPLYALGHLKGFALGWWTQEERLRTLQGNTHPLTWVTNEQNGYKCVVDHWGTHLFPPPKVKSERQKIERSKGKQGGNLRVEK
ncbi:hypothetical protein KY290_033528 [Solanum tuberosum]|uniref:Uncharacterized protein n=1 Tax=Solanum tuberosum TaxID=4113 RepID=A0ABQ7U0V1_SOLTU|nr:hypothetical protein KY289_032888 [Solanum tuberosum]KAH0647533.1 hypothetical protein KY285_032781 [Solanum tuberosum]KAH0740485.1 hypothetical protein KY290_033528 [Solanum tuberosum]